MKREYGEDQIRKLVINGIALVLFVIAGHLLASKLFRNVSPAVFSVSETRAPQISVDVTSTHTAFNAPKNTLPTGGCGCPTCCGLSS
jgi:hypothetical protein